MRRLIWREPARTADFHHSCEALHAIDAWMAQHDGTQPLTLIQHLLAEISARELNVRVIWYELGPSDDAVAAFTRLNVGKIPLTEAELVRALFPASQKPRRMIRLDRTAYRIAYEWDQIEKRLRNNAVWYFLQDKPEGTANRIGLVFRLAASRAGRLDNQDYAVFTYFSDKLKRDQCGGRMARGPGNFHGARRVVRRSRTVPYRWLHSATGARRS